MASHTHKTLGLGFCVSLDRWLTAYGESSTKLCKYICSPYMYWTLLLSNAVIHMPLTSLTKHTCNFVILPHQQTGTICCTDAWCVVGVWYSELTLTQRCAVPDIHAGHIWKHCSPTAGFLRTAWRLACQTMQPYEAEESQDQAGVWEWALPLVTLYVWDQIFFLKFKGLLKSH